MLANMGSNLCAFAKECGIYDQKLYNLCAGKGIQRESAEKIAGYLERPFSELFKPSRNRTPLSANTIRRIHSFLSMIFSQAVKEMLIPYNPVSKATPPAVEEQTPHYFQPETLVRVLEALESEDIRHRTMVHLLIVTGCRRGEIAGLKWEKIDFENKQIKIDRCLGYTPKTGIFEGQTKTKNTRFVTIPDETVALLRKYRRWHLEQQIMNGDRWSNTGYVFTKDDGTPIMPGTVNGWLDRFSKRHGLPHINPHAFRHTAASILIAEGVDIVTVSKMLGHANTNVTTNVYSHEIEEAKRKATECIAEVMLRRKKA